MTTTTTKGLLIASTAALFPWSQLFILVAVGIGALVFAIKFNDDFGAPSDEPSRCPACTHDALMRIETSRPMPISLLHCRHCGEAYRWCGGTLYRDTGKPLF
jgi:hypothetical protein